MRFARDYGDKGIAKREAVTVTSVVPAKNAVALEKVGGQSVDWRPRQWGACKSEAFMRAEIEIRQGDRIQFTRNHRTQSRENGSGAQVITVKPEGRTARFCLGSGTFQTLGLDKSTDQHLRHSYAQTYSARSNHGATDFNDYRNRAPDTPHKSVTPKE